MFAYAMVPIDSMASITISDNRLHYTIDYIIQ